MKLLFLHAYEIKPWEWDRNNALEWVPSTHAHTHTTSEYSKLTNWLLTHMITQLVVIKEVDISRFTETIRQKKLPQP